MSSLLSFNKEQVSPLVVMFLPVTHPEYRYPSSKNIYSTKIKEFDKTIYSDQQTEEHAGSWKSCFPHSFHKLHIEIGCNAGHVTLGWAEQNPQNAYIGIDWKFKMIYRAAEKAKKRGLENVLFLRANADRLEHIFGKSEVDHIHVFFSDPWPKKAHWKHRFFKPGQFEKLAYILKPGGTLEIRTDHAIYFGWIEALVQENPTLWKVLERTQDRHAGCPDPLKLEIPDVTLFEKIFIREGIKINSLILKKI